MKKSSLTLIFLLSFLLLSLSVRAWVDCTPASCESDYTDNGVVCSGGTCTRNCTVDVCGTSWRVAYSDTDTFGWSLSSTDEAQDDSGAYTPNSSKYCYNFTYKGPPATDDNIRMYVNTHPTLDCQPVMMGGFKGGSYVNSLGCNVGSQVNSMVSYLCKVINASMAGEESADQAYLNAASKSGSIFCTPNNIACDQLADSNCRSDCYNQSIYGHSVQGYYEKQGSSEASIYQGAGCGNSYAPWNRMTPINFTAYETAVIQQHTDKTCDRTNEAPNATNVKIIPENSTAGNDLQCNLTYYDAEGFEEKDSTFNWRKNGVGQNINFQVLGKGNLTVNDLWSCEVTPSDGLVYGTKAESSNVTILSTIQSPRMYVSGTLAWSLDGFYSNSDIVTNFSQLLNNALATCTADAEGYCNISMTFNSGSSGTLNLSDVQVYYRIGNYSPSNNPPTHSTPILNATDNPLNLTSANLTAYNQSTYDQNGDPVKSLYSWFVNNQSFATLNMPFESHGGNISSEALDYSGSGYHGTPKGWLGAQGPTWCSSCGYGNSGAYQFDGANDFVNLTNINLRTKLFRNDSGSTYCAWIRNINKITSDNVIFRLWSNNQGFLFRYDNNTQKFEIDNSLGWEVQYSNGLVGSSWYHVCIAYWGNGRNWTIYVNGTQEVTNVTFGSSFQSCTAANCSFSLSSISSEMYNGTMDEVLFFNRTLTAEQVNLIFNNKSNTISSKETEVGQTWWANVTPNDGSQDGISLKSNELTIQPPPANPFINGTFNRTHFTYPSMLLNSTFDGYFYSNGTYTSMVIDAGQTANWTNITWTEGSPYMEPLPNYGGTETVLGGVNMSGNMFLLHFDESAPNQGPGGSDVQDFSGNNIHGNESFGVTFGASGKYGKAIKIDGSIVDLSVGKDRVNFTSAATLEFWANFTEDKCQTIFSISGEPLARYHFIYIGDCYGADNYMISQYRLTDDGESSYGYNTSNRGELFSTGWHHVVWVWNGTRSSIYIDAQSKPNSTLIGSNDGKWGGVSGKVTIGARFFGDSYNTFASGEIDEFALYNRSLTQEEVLSHYKRGRGNLTLEYKSCGDISCSEVNFEGPVLNASFSNITLPTNRYFQYRALFQTEDINLTPELFDVDIGYKLLPNSPPNATSLKINTTDNLNRTNGTILGFFGYSDIDGNAQVRNQTRWFINFTYIATYDNLTMLNETNTTRGYNFTFSAHVYDGTDWGDWANSTTLTIANAIPEHTTPSLNATDSPTNSTNANLTVYNVSTIDIDGDNVRNIYNWFVNNESVAVVNMPFEGGSTSGIPGDDGLTADYSGYGNNGGVMNATFLPNGGFDGRGAYQFNNEDSGIVIPDADNLQANSVGISVSAWVYIKSFAAGSFPDVSDIIVSKGNDTTDSEYSLTIDGGPTPEIWFTTRGGGLTSGAAYLDVELNRWYHLVGINNGTHTSLYVNGIFRGAINANPLGNATGDLYIGMHPNTGNESSEWFWAFNGTIDEIMVFNRSLSAEQIKTLYENKTNIIVSHELTAGQTWWANITPNDGVEDGISLKSNELTIQSTPPVMTSALTNATDNPLNRTTANLTAYGTATDVDNDNLKYVYNWFVNNGSIAVLNTPFEAHSGDESVYTIDYSGNNYSGVIKGATWNATGGYGNSGRYEFYGDTNDYIEMSQVSGMNHTFRNDSGSTYCAWIKHRSIDAQDDVIFRITKTNTAGVVIRLDFSPSKIRVDNPIDWTTQTGKTYISPNTWYHTCVVYHGNGHNLSLFVNGTLDSNLSHSTGFVGCNNGGCLTQISDGSGTEAFNGTIDEVMVFNRSLSPFQIYALYTNQSNLIANQETTAGETWWVNITANDGTADSNSLKSNAVTIQNSPPQHNAPTLNATDNPFNTTTANLTVYNQSTADADSDVVKNIYNWYKNNVSLTLANLPFEGGSTSGVAGANGSAQDYSGYNNSGWVNMALWNSTGGYGGGGAYQFNGASDFITIPYTTNVILWGKFSIEMWAKRDLNDQTPYQLLATNNGGSTGSWAVYYNQYNILQWYIVDFETISASGVNSGKWHHIVITHDNTSTGNNTVVYIDGSQRASNNATDPYRMTSNRDILIGKREIGNFFNGTIDNFRIWNISLSPSQVYANYMNGSNIITKEATTTGETWYVNITPNDGVEDGNSLKSNEITIQNAPPSAASVKINTTDNLNRTNGTILGFFDYSDADGDAQSRNQTRWFINHTYIPSFDNLTWLNETNSSKGYNFTFSARVYDGAYWSEWANSTTLTIANAMPENTAPVLNATDNPFNTTNANLTAYNQSTYDADGDKVENIYNWFVNNKSQALVNLPFEGGSTSGSTTANGSAQDYTGYNHSGIVTTATWNSTGGYGSTGGYYFNGTTDYITIPYNENLVLGRQYSIDLWVNHWGIYDYYAYVIDNGAVSTGHWAIDLYYGAVQYVITDKETLATGAYQITPYKWHHIAVTYDNLSASNNTLIYVDGVYSKSGHTSKPSKLTANILIGKRAIGNSFNGSIDNVRIWNRSLSASQVYALYMNRTDLITSDETTAGEVWYVNVTPNDGVEDGVSLKSNEITIQDALDNYPPTHSTPILNATDNPNNTTTANLTAYNQSTSDLDGSVVKNIYSWFFDNKSLSLIYLPFEGGSNGTNETKGVTKDYSGWGKTYGTFNVTWNLTNGYGVGGSYEFYGGGFINLSGNPENTTGNITITFWAKSSSTTASDMFSSLRTGSVMEIPVIGWYEYPYASISIYDSLSWIRLDATQLNDNKWHHYAFAFNGSTSGGKANLTYYRDGAYVNKTPFPINALDSRRIVIGSNVGGSGSYYTGTIDEFIVWNRTLSPEQIYAIANNKTNILTAPETKVGETWFVNVTPNDGIEDGLSLKSNSITIQ